MLKCPICKKVINNGKELKLLKIFPFCSQQCKWIDLGRWFDANYKIEEREKYDEE